MNEQFSIGELGRRSGCKVATIRYYEDIGLLAPSPRTSGGHRQYGDDAVHRLVFIRRSRELGFTLDEIRSLLELARQEERSCAEVDALASAHVQEIDQKIESLAAMRDALTAVLDECERTTIHECRVIDALSPAP